MFYPRNTTVENKRIVKTRKIAPIITLWGEIKSRILENQENQRFKAGFYVLPEKYNRREQKNRENLKD